MGFDRYSSLLEEMLVFCESFIRNSRTLTSEPSRPKDFDVRFSAQSGVIPALWLVGSRCREPRLRRRAISLLLEARSRESVRSSVFTAYTLKTLVAVEEGHIGSVKKPQHVGIEDRILAVRLCYDPGYHSAARFVNETPSLTLRYIRPPSNEHCGRWFEKTVTINPHELLEHDSMQLCSSQKGMEPLLAAKHLQCVKDRLSSNGVSPSGWLLSTGRYDKPWMFNISYDLQM